MTRLNIAIDCDDVLIHGTKYIVDVYNQKYGTKVTLAKAHGLDISEWEVSREKLMRRIDEIQSSDEYAKIAPASCAVDSIKRLAANHDLCIVTARTPALMQVTKKMADKYMPGCFKHLEHVGQDTPKGEVCVRLKSDVLIDDSLRNLKSAKECGVVNRIWFGDYAWQADQKSNDVYTIRCKDWAEVEKEIERIIQQ